MFNILSTSPICTFALFPKHRGVVYRSTSSTYSHSAGFRMVMLRKKNDPSDPLMYAVPGNSAKWDLVLLLLCGTPLK